MYICLWFYGRVGENVITGVANTTGMIIQNSIGNHYDCNITNNTAEGLGVYYNSEEQEIKGNQFDALIDLALRSAVGLQPHHGNKFFGGSVKANELSLDDRINSKFKANQNNPELWPSDIEPNDGSWWDHQPNLNQYTCDGSFGPGWVPFSGDPNKLCVYWNYLKAIQASTSELFFIKLYHLLKYSKTKAGYNLPNCIKLDPVFLTVCGLTKLVDVSLALDKIGKVNTNSSNLSNLQSQYIQEQTEVGRIATKNQIETEILTFALSIEYDRIQDSLRLDSLETDLNTINCAHSIVVKWKAILKLYIKFLKQGEVVQNDRSALLAYSTDCSDMYGDAIHLARAMANTFDDTYFDQYDNCLQQSEPRRRENLLSDITIYPNPSNGDVYINTAKEFIGKVIVYNASGIKLKEEMIESKEGVRSIHVADHGGIYFIAIIANNGETSSHKVFVIK